MDTAYKVNALTLNAEESQLLLGTESGEMLVVDTGNLSLIGAAQGHVGAIYAIAAHPSLPLVATMGMDRRVSLWDSDEPSRPRIIDRFNLRRVTPWNDMVPIPNNPSQSQAVCFHASLPRLATRSANAGLVELNYDGDSLKLIHCTRLHGNEDLTTVRYISETERDVLSGALGSVVLSRDGLVLSRYQLAQTNVHWFEPVGNRRYLVASDDRRVVLFDVGAGKIIVEGPLITRDDLEHVTYNRTSGKAYVAGFDRNIYEIDPRSCVPLGVVYTAPFKMRWIKTLTSDPNCLFFQCFDGGVHKIDLAGRRTLTAIRRTPPAIWTAAILPDGKIAITGEGDEIALVQVERSAGSRKPVFRLNAMVSKRDASSYTKRMAAARDGSLWLAQTSGKLIRWLDGESKIVDDAGSAIRDLCLSPAEDRVYTCLEKGEVRAIDVATQQCVASFKSEGGEPIWTVSCRPESGTVLAIERGGRSYFLDPTDLSLLRAGPRARRSKRAKWIDDDTLIANYNDTLIRYHYAEDRAEELVEACGNTIEDFTYNFEYGYLVAITYSTDLVLCDLMTGAKLYIGADQCDYSKGLLFLPSVVADAYPLDFITFGRSGTAHLFRIHNEKCVALGPILPTLLTRRNQVDGAWCYEAVSDSDRAIPSIPAKECAVRATADRTIVTVT